MIWVFAIVFVVVGSLKIAGFVRELRAQDEETRRQLDAEFCRIEREVDAEFNVKNSVRGASEVTAARLNAEGKAWQSRENWIASIDDPVIPAAGTWAKFEYADRDGVLTMRHIRQWSKRGAYIEGFCMERREGRTFRQDRISGWQSG